MESDFGHRGAQLARKPGFQASQVLALVLEGPVLGEVNIHRQDTDITVSLL